MDLGKEDLKQVWAMLPSYNDEMVNGTLLVFENHQKWIGVRTATLKEHLAKEFCIDFAELRRRTGEAVKNKRHMPLIFSRDCKFIQVHFRRPDHTYDGAYGMVRIDVIQNMIQEKNETKIILTNNKIIHVLDKRKTLEVYLKEVETAMNTLPQLQLDLDKFHDLIFEEMEIIFERVKSEWH